MNDTGPQRRELRPTTEELQRDTERQMRRARRRERQIRYGLRRPLSIGGREIS